MDITEVHDLNRRLSRRLEDLRAGGARLWEWYSIFIHSGRLTETENRIAELGGGLPSDRY